MSDTPIDLVLARLQGVRKTANGWDALCPADDDHEPSLGIAAAVESGIPFLTLEQRTEVARASIPRFVSGKRSLRLDMAGRLAAYFGLELRSKHKKG